MISRSMAFAPTLAFVVLIGENALAQEPTPAESPPQATHEDLARMDGLLKHFASQSRGYRTWGGISALAIGAATIPSGVVMMNDSNNSVWPLVLGMGIGEVIGGGLLLALPFGSINDFQTLSDELAEQQASGKPPGEIVDAVEAEWRDRAESSRTARHVAGILGVSVGALAVAGGTYLALAAPIGSDISRNDQDGFSAALLALGYTSAILGFQAFFFESPIEAAWETYQSETPGAARPVVGSFHLNGVGLGPAPGGGVVALGASF